MDGTTFRRKWMAIIDGRIGASLGCGILDVDAEKALAAARQIVRGLPVCEEPKPAKSGAFAAPTMTIPENTTGINVNSIEYTRPYQSCPAVVISSGGGYGRSYVPSTAPGNLPAACEFSADTGPMGVKQETWHDRKPLL